VSHVLVELVERMPHRRPVARADHAQRELAQALQRLEVLAEVLRDEHAAFAEHGVAGEARALPHEREVVGRVARHGVDRERAEPLAVAQPHVGGVAARADPRAAEPLTQRQQRLDVVLVVVRDRDPSGAAARLDRGGDVLDVLGDVGAGVDHPRGVAADDPRVRAGQRVGARVLGPDARDVEPVELLDAHRGTRR